MKLRLRVAMLFVAFFVAMFTMAHAQEDSADSVEIEINIDSLRAVPPNSIRVGIGGSAHWTGETRFQLPPMEPSCMCDWILTGSMNGFSGHIETGFSNLYGIEPLSVIGRLRVMYMEGEARREEPNTFSIPPDNKPVHRRAYFDVASAHFDLLLEYSPLSILTLRGGASIGYRYSSSAEIWRTADSTSPRSRLNGRFIGLDSAQAYGPRDVRDLEMIYSGRWDEFYVDPVSFGPIVQIASPWPITDRLTITPEFGIRWELNRLPVDSELWPAMELNAGATLTYVFDAVAGE